MESGPHKISNTIPPFVTKSFVHQMKIYNLTVLIDLSTQTARNQL